MSERIEMSEELLDDVNGGYIGFNYNEFDGYGTIGLGANRNYKFTDYNALKSYLDSTPGEGDVSRMRGLIAAGIITKIG